MKNIIVIMTDDQGYGDLSCMGSGDFVTPHIDALASRGTRFTSMYSNSPVCSPSRASLLTGRYPGNAGVRSILGGNRRASGLMPDVPNIASALKSFGYDTAHIGKWHLGLRGGCRPNSNGFDYFYGFLAGCIDYYSHIFYWGMNSGRGSNPTHDLWENDREVYANGEYFTDLVSEKAVKYIRGKAQENKPFFLYLAYNAPHYPMHAPEKYTSRFAHLPWDRAIMAAMLSAVDDGIGSITAELGRQGILGDTLIYYQSDNGPSRESRNWLDGTPDPYYGGSAGGLKGGKFSLFDGGIRVPAIISLPGVIPCGQVTDTPCAAMDIFPTIINAVGGDAEKYEFDGTDIMPYLSGRSGVPHDMIFWEMGRQTAVRSGKYKLVLNGELCEGEPEQDEIFLSDIETDFSESVNIKDIEPEICNKLKNAALIWRTAIETRWKKDFEKNYTSQA